MLLFLVLTGCSEPEVDLSPPGPPPEERARMVDADLEAAHRAWMDQDLEEAGLIARRAYTEHFEPMEPLLRSEDALRTLELEYSFGLLFSMMAREDTAREVTRLIGVLREGVADLVLVVSPPEESVSSSASEHPQGEKGE